MKHKKNQEEAPEKKDTIQQEEVAAGEEIIDWQAKAEEYLNDFKRCQADFENYKKRQALQQKEIGAYLTEKLVMDIVPVMDNFRMATEHVPETEKSSSWVTGIQYIEKQLEKVLSENGVITIEVKIGDIFDPKIHEAIDIQQTVDNPPTDEAGIEQETKEKKQIIANVIQNGFKIGEKIIRPAKVIVTFL
jgi:molecular chaperone GrpE